MPKALCIMAHPDDLDFVAGGSVLLWSRAGWDVELAVITSGNRGSDDPGGDVGALAEVRRREQAASAERLGVSRLTWLGHDDGSLEPTLALRSELVGIIRRSRPDRVVCQDPTRQFVGRHYVNHADHRAAGRAAIDAVYPSAKKPLIFPERGVEPHVVRELWLAAPTEPDTFVDISEVLEEKVQAVLQHRSQFPDERVADFVRSWARDTARYLPVEAAEAFRTFDLRAKTVHHRFDAALEVGG